MPLSNSLLVLRADYELATQYLAAYMAKIVDAATQRGFNVIDLHSSMATKQQFFDALEVHDPLIVIAGGHGNETSFAGQHDETVLEACHNDQVMAEREAIFNSCSVGVALGPSMVSKNARFFAGYRADYLFMLEDPSPPNLLDDEYAAPFMNCIIEPALTRIKGGGTTQIYGNTVNKFNNFINAWWNSGDEYAQEVISLLVHNRDNFMVTGASGGILQNSLPLLALAGIAYVVLKGKI